MIPTQSGKYQAAGRSGPWLADGQKAVSEIVTTFKKEGILR